MPKLLNLKVYNLTISLYHEAIQQIRPQRHEMTT